MSKLTTSNHSSDSAGLRYVYPVISRRLGGLSIGINFNTNNACNWRCIYCQVPNLQIGVAPPMDFELLAEELRIFLDDVLHGDFYQRFQVEESQRVIKDIAIAGNGEPTSLTDFAQAVSLVGQVATQAGVLPGCRYVLISNGSLIHQTQVQAGLQVLDAFGGELWYKLDSATVAGRRLINNTRQPAKASLDNLLLAASLCPTKIQTCLVDVDKRGLSPQEKAAYLGVLKRVKDRASPIQEVLLYTIARPSLQPEAPRLAPMAAEVLAEFAEDIRRLGYTVSVSI